MPGFDSSIKTAGTKLRREMTQPARQVFAVYDGTGDVKGRLPLGAIMSPEVSAVLVAGKVALLLLLFYFPRTLRDRNTRIIDSFPSFISYIYTIITICFLFVQHRFIIFRRGAACYSSRNRRPAFLRRSGSPELK